MKKRWLAFLIMAIVWSSGAFAQNYLFSTTNNLIVRDCPETEYTVLLLLHKNCMVKVDNDDKGYEHNKAVTSKFCKISFTYFTTDNRTHKIGGWVMKKFLTNQPPPIPKDTNAIPYTLVNLIPYSGERENNPNKNNRLAYPYPKYKGGEPVLVKPKLIKKYVLGARGGCYYLTQTGSKVYVDKKYCKELLKKGGEK